VEAAPCFRFSSVEEQIPVWLPAAPTHVARGSASVPSSYSEDRCDQRMNSEPIITLMGGFDARVCVEREAAVCTRGFTAMKKVDRPDRVSCPLQHRIGQERNALHRLLHRFRNAVSARETPFQSRNAVTSSPARNPPRPSRSDHSSNGRPIAPPGIDLQSAL
jgi:hypothetical protein